MRDYSFEAMRDDVARFMEQVGILAAIVVGHSMGAVTAYDLAATRPDLIRLLVLEEMLPPDPATPPKPIPRRPDPRADYDWRALVAVYRWRNATAPGPARPRSKHGLWCWAPRRASFVRTAWKS